MIDLGARDLSVDPAAKRAVCGGGTRWSQLDAATQEHGLATPGGFISHTGVAGLTLGGGLGWLSRRAGLSATTCCRSSSSPRPARSCGRPRRRIRSCSGRYGAAAATSAWSPRSSSSSTTSGRSSRWAVVLGPRKRAGGLPSHAGPDPVGARRRIGIHGGAQCTAGAVRTRAVPGRTGIRRAPRRLWLGRGAPPALAALREAAPPTFAFDTPIPYTSLQQMFDESAPWGIRGYEKAVYLDELTDAVIEVIARHLPKKPSPMSFMPIFVLGGRYADVPTTTPHSGGAAGRATRSTSRRWHRPPSCSTRTARGCGSSGPTSYRMRAGWAAT